MARCAESLERVLAGDDAPDAAAEADLDATLVERGVLHESELGVPFMRFLEHMLLDEHAAPDRGNGVHTAVEGFRQFWGKGKDAHGRNRDIPTHVAPRTAALFLPHWHVKNAVQDAPNEYDTSIPGEWGEPPYLIVVGPECASPHAVAFLVSVTESLVTCHYANTGRGATPCKGSRGRVLVRKWVGHAIIPLIKLALARSFDDAGFDAYADQLSGVEGYVEPCIAWDGVEHDGRLLLAQYAQEGGTVVSLPQRGGTCTYGCVLWLIGPIMHTRETAREMELEMKRRAVVYLTSVTNLGYRNLFHRDVLRVMEATVATYADYAPLAVELAALRARIDQTFHELHGRMLSDSRGAKTVFYHRIRRQAAQGELALDMGTDPFDSIASAGVWCGALMRWLGTMNTPASLYCLFLHKAREVLCVSELRGVPSNDECTHVVVIAKYLSLYGLSTIGLENAGAETAMGMLVRCARVAARAHARVVPVDGATCLAMPRSAFPWVVAETRALEIELRDCAYRNLDAGASGQAPEGQTDALVVRGALEFERGEVSSVVWGGFCEYMARPESAALSAVLFLCSVSEQGDEGLIRARHALIRDHHLVRLTVSDGKLGYEKPYDPPRLVPVFRYLVPCESDGGFHADKELKKSTKSSVDAPAGETEMESYMRHSTDDRTHLLGGASAPRARKTPRRENMAGELLQMDLDTRSGDWVAQSDVVELERWVDAEHAAWHGDGFRAMAAHRSLQYCAGKYLIPMSRGRLASTERLDSLLESAPDSEWAALMRAVHAGDLAPLKAELEKRSQAPQSALLALHYAVLKGHAPALFRAEILLVSADGDVRYSADARLTPYPLTLKAGASIRKGDSGNSHISVRTAGSGGERRLAFECDGGVRGTVVWALRLANVPSLHWRYSTRRYEIHACGVVIRFRTGGDTRPTIEVDGGVYSVDARPSEWSSLWYTTPYAAVLPVRDARGALSLAVFMSTSADLGAAAGGIWFTYCSGRRWKGARAVLTGPAMGEFFVVPFDAAGVMPSCSHARARVLLLAYSRGSLCAARLMRVVAAGKDASEETGQTGRDDCPLGEFSLSCVFADYAGGVLGLPCAKSRDACAGLLERGAAKARGFGGVDGPMRGVVVAPDGGGVFRVVRPTGGASAAADDARLSPYRKQLEGMRDENRARRRFVFGIVAYDAGDRAAAYLSASIEAYENCFSPKGNERLGVLMGAACLAPLWPCSAARLAFEAHTGRFLTKRQIDLIGKMKVKGARSASQLNMGFGKSAVVVPMLVLEMLTHARVVIVTQPEHLVASATRTVCAAVAARPGSESVFVAGAHPDDLTRASDGPRVVVVCSSVELQRVLLRLAAEDEPLALYARQAQRAHIADEIDETSDPLTCEVSVTSGAPVAHYEQPDALTFHTEVCDLVLGNPVVGPADGTTYTYTYHERLNRIYDLTAAGMRLGVNFGLVDTEGVYLALPYKFAGAPAHQARYKHVDLSAVLTARASLAACKERGLSVSARAELRRALVQIAGHANAERIVRKADQTQTFRLYAALVALRQVRFYASEVVVSFLDVLGIADTFAAFSGTMAFDLPIPRVKLSDTRAPFMPVAKASASSSSSASRFLVVDPDTEGNLLVKRHITGGSRERVDGAYEPGRAIRVVAELERLYALVKARGRQMVVIDASGEFGLLDGNEFLAGARGFTELGLSERGTFVYYDHKNSRGTDAKLDHDAEGWAVVDWATSTATAVAQSMYRLRGIDYAQTIGFIVCGGSPADLTGKQLYKRLAANEVARSNSVAARGRIQCDRAQKNKGTMARGDRFVFANDPGDSDMDLGGLLGTQTQTQTQAQTQTQTQAQARVTDCVAVDNSSKTMRRLDPLAPYRSIAMFGASLLAVTSELVKSMRSKLRGKLLQTRIHVSPLLMYRPSHVGRDEYEHAFAVVTERDTATSPSKSKGKSNGKSKPPPKKTVVICAVIEVWAKRTDAEALRDVKCAYSRTGTLLRGTPESESGGAGRVLFGRCLCGDTLVYDEQMALMQYLRDEYKTEGDRNALREVLSCLHSDGLVPAQAGLVKIPPDADWATRSLAEPPADLTFVKRVMNMTAYGGVGRGRFV
jgi:hypothetical protein